MIVAVGLEQPPSAMRGFPTKIHRRTVCTKLCDVAMALASTQATRDAWTPTKLITCESFEEGKSPVVLAGLGDDKKLPREE